MLRLLYLKLKFALNFSCFLCTKINDINITKFQIQKMETNRNRLEQTIDMFKDEEAGRDTALTAAPQKMDLGKLLGKPKPDESSIDALVPNQMPKN